MRKRQDVVGAPTRMSWHPGFWYPCRASCSVHWCTLGLCPVCEVCPIDDQKLLREGGFNENGPQEARILEHLVLLTMLCIELWFRRHGFSGALRFIIFFLLHVHSSVKIKLDLSGGRG